MRNILIAAAALVAFAGSANTAARHTWYNADYGTGACVLSHHTPEEIWGIIAGPFGSTMGYVTDRISPDDVVKTGNGLIHVTIRATLNGQPTNAEFLASKR